MSCPILTSCFLFGANGRADGISQESQQQRAGPEEKPSTRGDTSQRQTCTKRHWWKNHLPEDIRAVRSHCSDLHMQCFQLCILFARKNLLIKFPGSKKSNSNRVNNSKRPDSALSKEKWRNNSSERDFFRNILG